MKAGDIIVDKKGRRWLLEAFQRITDEAFVENLTGAPDDYETVMQPVGAARLSRVKPEKAQ